MSVSGGVLCRGEACGALDNRSLFCDLAGGIDAIDIDATKRTPALRPTRIAQLPGCVVMTKGARGELLVGSYSGAVARLKQKSLLQVARMYVSDMMNRLL